MKGYYIFLPLEEGCVGPTSGIEKKIRTFCKVLKEQIDISLDILPVYQQEKSKIARVVKRWMLWQPVGHKWEYDGQYADADFLYIRKVDHDRTFINFLRDIKKQNPDIKILYEMPTYPYEKEQKLTIKNFPIYAKDRIYRKKLKKYVDRIVTFYNQKEILGIQTICIMNGYDFSNINDTTYTLSKDKIEMIEVSTTAFWHGYDRIIEGLKNYYQNGGEINIVFHMVGAVIEEHRELVKKYNLESHVVFYGPKSGKELEGIYKKCSMGVDVLGGHRKDYPVSSSLKSREYAEKGMPVITSSPIDYIPSNYKYQLLCPYDDSSIDMNQVIEFYQSIFEQESVSEVVDNVRKTAIENCDFHETLKPIIQYLKR